MVARQGFMERVRAIAGGGTTLILITHHIEEIVPEIGRVVLLRGGRIVADGPKRETLMSPLLGDVFDGAVAVDEVGGYFYARPAAGVGR
jgi:iron complex transport system ATP-binding protein